MLKNILFLVFCLNCCYAQDIPCNSPELEHNFPETYVNNVLEFYNVPKNKWKYITEDLSSKEGTIEQIIKEKASKINPNPLVAPVQFVTVSRLYRETLYETFRDVMKNNDVENEATIRDMLSRILDLKGKRFLGM